MTTERVDKQWKEKGLSSYTTEAILGTLAHYGVNVNEAAFRGLARERNFIEIAREWSGSWDAARQFQAFPLYASAELWRRWEKERLSEFEFAEALADLVEELVLLTRGGESRVAQAFAAFNALKPRLPAEQDVRDAFMDAVHFWLSDVVPGGLGILRWFEELMRVLPEKGLLEVAQAYTDVVELVVSSRAGVARAALKIHQGLKKEGTRELVAIAGDPSRPASNRLRALEALFFLIHAYTDVEVQGQRALKDAESAGDYHFAEAFAGLITGALERLDETDETSGNPEIRRRHAEISARLAEFEEAHDRMHPECAHWKKLGVGIPGWGYREG